MAAPRHARVTFSGVFGSIAAPVEIWVFGVSMDLAGPTPGFGSLKAMADTASFAWITHLAPKIGPDARLTRTRVAVVGDGGLVERGGNGAYAQADTTSDTPGQAGAAAYPGVYQVSQAVSTVTQQVGAVGRGRFFLPEPAFSAQPSGLQVTSDTQGIATNAAAFIRALNTDAANNGLLGVVVASGGSVTKGIPPALYPVVSVRVGRRLDVIRSRANAIPESYVTAAV